ncbi:hypothetical protein WG66_013076 [Moniliophthora roreri]|nr:hypothetical protein WG66_013076 [Moniliophthora roreri]
MKIVSPKRNLYRSRLDKFLTSRGAGTFAVARGNRNPDFLTTTSTRPGVSPRGKMDCQSPIYNLPSEILSTILMFCCEENELSSPPNQPIVITLSAVCGNWREIVLATPALWSKLDIVAESPSVNNGFISYLTQMTQLFMQRSKHAPLTWSLTCFNNQPFLPIYNHLIENSERWSDISLFVDDTLLQDPVSLSVSGHIPMLKRLELNGLYIPREWNIFAVAPALSVVDCVPANSYDIYLPWVQIRDLTLRYSHIPESLYILSQCPNLEQLKLECISGEETYPDVDMTTVPITLHQVHALSIISEKGQEDTFG